MTTGNLDFLQTVLEHTEESIFLINTAGIVTIVARETDKALVGKPIMDAVSKVHRERVGSAIDEAFQFKRPVTCELKGRLGTGRAAWFSCRISPILREGKAISAVVFASDITDRRAAYLAQRKTDKQALDKARQRSKAVENILTMCAKTKRIRFKGEWLTIEDFLWQRYGFRISHGLSPAARDEALKIIDEAVLPNGEAEQSRGHLHR